MDSLDASGLEATRARYVTSYAKRRAYGDSPQNLVQFPPMTTGVTDFVDIHAHAHKRQQDGPALARLASEAGMRAMMMKTVPDFASPMRSLNPMVDELRVWADERQLEPVRLFAGYLCEVFLGGVDPEKVREQLEQGVKGIWLPVASHANSVNQVGGRPFWWSKSSNWSELVGPVPWEIAREDAGYVLDANGKLDPNVAEVIRLCAEFDAMLSFGHVTPEEQEAVANEVVRQNFTRAIFDHPLSPFVNLSPERMVEYTRAGMWLNFTYDELSPLLGVDPQYMYDCIRLVGPEHVTLSCDAGEPFFPNSVECMRLMAVYMGAFGLTDDELRQVCVDNPSYLLGLA